MTRKKTPSNQGAVWTTKDFTAIRRLVKTGATGVEHLIPTELHDAHRVSGLSLIRYEVLRNPQGTCTHHSPHPESRRLVR